MSAPWRIRTGDRIYAVGDIHGRADLFADLLATIRTDNAGREPARTRIILLGDVIDRGSESAPLVGRLMRYTRASPRFQVLKGNHEQIMLASLAGDYAAAEMWIKFGGAETLLSWGVPEPLIVEGPIQTLLWRARQCIPPDVIRWMGRLKVHYRSGDVLFVHAGIRPGVPLARQDPLDMMWIREEFLDAEADHPFLVVHGHSVVEGGPDVRSNRIGLDTGAYRTGRLTAMGFEGGKTWTLCSTI